MSRIFMTGFEDGSTNAFTAVNSVSIETSQKRTGSYSARMNGWDDYCRYVFSSTVDELYIRFAWYPTGDFNQQKVGIFSLYNASGTQVILGVDRTSLCLETYRNTTLLDSSSVALLFTAWNVIECHIKIADAPDGIFTVKLNGSQVIASTGDTQAQATAGATTLQFGQLYIASGNTAPYGYLDDIAVNDTSGSTNNSWVGPGGIRPLLVNGAGNHTGLTPSTGSNYQCVDEVPASDTDYVYGSEVDAYDLYAVNNAALPDTIAVSAVRWIARAKVANDAANITPVIRSGSTTQQQSDIALSTSYTVKSLIMNVDPTDSEDWTLDKVKALEIGAAIG